MIPDLAQKVCEHLKRREVSRFGHRRKYSRIRVNRIVRDFVLAYRTDYFDLQRFKSFQVIVAQAKKGKSPSLSLRVINNVKYNQQNFIIYK